MEREVKQWITVNGHHVPIYEGQTKEEAINSFMEHKANVDSDEAKKERQIAESRKQAETASANEQKQDKHDSTIESFDIKSLGELKDADNDDDFIEANLKNPKFMQFGRERGIDACRQLWYEMRRQKAIENLKEMPIEKAIETVRENIKASHLSGWFRNGDSEYKPRIAEQLFGHEDTLNASLNIAYYNYKNEMQTQQKKALSFEEWLVTPQTVYRGTSGQKLIDSDVFTSYTPSKKTAEDFAHGTGGKSGSQHGGEAQVSSMTIRPIDTWGQLQTNGEYEFMIPITIDAKSEKRRKK